jgi:pimeloyl-ACP methyl ester carboxylesterase
MRGKRLWRGIVIAAATVLVVVAVIAVIARSQRSDTVNPYGALGSQRPVWQLCDWSREPAWRSAPVTYCADLKAPMDWYDLSKGQITIRVSRVAATGARRGILAFNPGGPNHVHSEQLATTIAHSRPELLRAYDMIGFAPRGVAPSTVLDCPIDWSQFQPVTDELDRSPANTARQVGNARLEGQSCAHTPFAADVTTDQTARDLDLIRAVLGAPTLNYLGYSYGTGLGAWYAAIFPDRVDRFVLDSNMPWSAGDMWQRSDASWAPATQRRFDEQFLPWLARHNDRFGLGGTVEQVRAYYRETRVGLVSVGMAESFDVAQYRLMTSAKAWQAWAATLRTLHDQPSAATTLLKAVRVPFAKDHSGIDQGAFWALHCGDSVWTEGPGDLIHIGDTLSAQYPLLGGLYTEEPCAFYPYHSTHQPHPTAAAMPRLLMVDDQLDPATPAEGAIATAAATGEPMIFVLGAGDHTVFAMDGNLCVDHHVDAYLIEGQRPESATCQANPLPLDDRTYPVAGPLP